ncbi:hypothetical protein CVT26_009538 [Gymnopilus dilepis]|uniref:Uncharacterized protein n=1 Tax=Gymnopilus dilepis TaxID=231916 RepID=A0A409VKI1_9AGAR|nr:hypothetical protein CVT26_009538 [Gymnopilus dilepis]
MEVGGLSQRKDRDLVSCIEDKIFGFDPILSLFQGRVIDQTDHSIETKYSTYWMRHRSQTKWCTAAAETNKSNDFSGQGVYGLVIQTNSNSIHMTLPHRSSILTKAYSPKYKLSTAVGTLV